MAKGAQEHLAAGECKLADEPIPVTVDCFLRGVFKIGDVHYAQVRIPTDEIAPGSYKVIPVPRSLVRVPAMVRGPKI